MKLIHLPQLLIVGLLFIPIRTSFAQKKWQQEVSYQINVQLNDTEHTLNGFLTLGYTNNSPDVLGELYFHLWPNAYKDKNTTLAKQLYNEGNSILFGGDSSVFGYMSGLLFEVDGTTADWSYYEDFQDVAVVKLPKPLNPGQKLILTTPFRVKLPSGLVSRLGHIDQTYQITQWYPKPAVYDETGWHPYPYLNQGEFYSEFGDFDVSITLPKNYVVGATGDLQTVSELNFLDSLANLPIPPPEITALSVPSSADLKTIRFKQSRVHDFAWFADKRYIVRKGSVTLPHSGRNVSTYAMFTPSNANLWEKSIEYINDGVYYYSLWNGDYPYNQVTAVDGTISAGGGMEYPNVTIIGNMSSPFMLEVVIVHEVGHNWFYGVLGSNEREHGWMDEGLNTFNEIRYIQTKYEKNNRLSRSLPQFIDHHGDLDYRDQSDLQFQMLQRMGEDQPIETTSPTFNSLNYGVVMYQKTGLALHYLFNYLGDTLFDRCMRSYYLQYQFKHPQPADLKRVFEEQSGKKLDWFFNELIPTRKRIDFRMKKVVASDSSTFVEVSSKGEMEAPVPVRLIGADTTWVWLNTQDGQFSTTVPGVYSRAEIDPHSVVPETNRTNNYRRESGLMKSVEPFKLRFYSGFNAPEQSEWYVLPMLAFNKHDKAAIGLAIHNFSIPLSPWTFYLAPLYSLQRNDLVGKGEIRHVKTVSGWDGKQEYGLQVQSFGLSETADREHDYWAFIPYFNRVFYNPTSNSPWRVYFKNKGLYNQTISPFITYEYWGYLNELKAQFRNIDHEWNFGMRNTYVTDSRSSDGFSRSEWSVEYVYRYLHKKMERKLELRAYTGNNWLYRESVPNGDSYGIAVAGANGAQDFFLEQVSFDRNGFSARDAQLRMNNMGAFRSNTPLTSSRYLIAANTYFELPIPKLNIGAFADYGYIPSSLLSTQAHLVNVGLGMRIRNVFGLYFPLWQNEPLANTMQGWDYWSKIRLTLNINILHREWNLNYLF